MENYVIALIIENRKSFFFFSLKIQSEFKKYKLTDLLTFLL